MILDKPEVSSTDMKACDNEAVQLLNEIAVPADDDESEEEEEEQSDDDDGGEGNVASIRGVQQNRRCVFCNKKSSISMDLFHICGHAYCRCASQALSTSVSFPLQCSDCKANIHIRDIRIIFSNEDILFRHLLKRSIQTYLTQNAQQDDRVFCPNDECDGLIKSSYGYQTCLTCSQSVCPKCQVINDELHVNRTCDEVVEEKKRLDCLPELFKAAKKFVEENWPCDAEMRPIG